MSISVHCFNTFEKSLLELRWWNADVKLRDELEILTVPSTANLSEALRYSLSYAVCGLAGVEHFVVRARAEVLPQVQQAAAFAFVELVSKHEAAKALLYEAIVSANIHQISSSAYFVDSLLTEVGGLLFSPQYGLYFVKPEAVEFYQQRFSKLLALAKHRKADDAKKEILRSVAVTI